MLRQRICLVIPGGHPDSKGLRPEGTKATMDCPCPHVSHGYAGIFDACISQGGCLDMLPGCIVGLQVPAELLIQLPHSATLQLLQGCVGLLHKEKSCLDVRLGVKICLVHTLRICLCDGAIPDGKLAMRDLFGHSLKSLLLQQLVDQSLGSLIWRTSRSASLILVTNDLNWRKWDSHMYSTFLADDF